MDLNAIAIISSTVAGSISATALGAIWWDLRGFKASMKTDVKSLGNEIGKRLDKIVDEHNSCQRELPEKYGRREDVAKLFCRVDVVEGDIRYLNGIRNGSRGAINERH